MISLNDMFGFECLPRNRIEQLMINSLNEQLQYHYNQRMFAWELLELEEEQIPHSTYKFHDNRSTVDHLMSKPRGLFFYLDDATRDRMNYEFITGKVDFSCKIDCVFDFEHNRNFSLQNASTIRKMRMCKELADMSSVWLIILEGYPMIVVIWLIKIEIFFRLKWFVSQNAHSSRL